MKWEEIKTHFSKATKKAASKTKDFADITALKFKLKGLEITICEEYENLGRLYYSLTQNNEDNQSKIDEKIAKIVEIKAEIAALEAEIKEAKEASKAKKKAEKAQKEDADGANIYEGAAEKSDNAENDTEPEAKKDTDKE